MTRITKLLLFASCSLGMSGCSSLTRISYYAPSHENAMPDKQMAFVRCVRLSGPPVAQRINIGDAELVIRVSSDQVAESQKTYSFGPAWFPVIPTLFNWFIPYNYRRSTPDVEINVIFKNIKTDMVWEPYKSTLVVPEGSPIRPSKIEGQDKKIIKQGEILKIKKSWTSWEEDLSFSLPKTTNEFILYIGGLSSDGVEIAEIPIAFKYSKGWVMGFIP